MRRSKERLIRAFNRGEREKFNRICFGLRLKPDDVWKGLKTIEDDIMNLSEEEIIKQFISTKHENKRITNN